MPETDPTRAAMEAVRAAEKEARRAAYFANPPPPEPDPDPLPESAIEANSEPLIGS